jgi:hypothetical protein
MRRKVDVGLKAGLMKTIAEKETGKDQRKSAYL